MKILTKKGKTLDLSEVRKTFTSIHPNVTISEGDIVIPLLDALEAILSIEKTKTPYSDWNEAASGNYGNYDDCASAGFDVGRNDAINEMRVDAGLME